jgi:hypothetical protein
VLSSLPETNWRIKFEKCVASKGLRDPFFGCVARKGLTGANFGCVANKGVSDLKQREDRLGSGDPRLVSELHGSLWHAKCIISIDILLVQLFESQFGAKLIENIMDKQSEEDFAASAALLLRYRGFGVQHIANFLG